MSRFYRKVKPCLLLPVLSNANHTCHPHQIGESGEKKRAAQDLVGRPLCYDRLVVPGVWEISPRRPVAVKWLELLLNSRLNLL